MSSGDLTPQQDSGKERQRLNELLSHGVVRGMSYAHNNDGSIKELDLFIETQWGGRTMLTIRGPFINLTTTNIGEG